MLTHTQIDHLKRYARLGWIAALRSAAIRELFDGQALQLSLFHKKHIAELTSPLHRSSLPNGWWRLTIRCWPRKRKRDELRQAIKEALTRVAREAA